MAQQDCHVLNEVHSASQDSAVDRVEMSSTPMPVAAAETQAGCSDIMWLHAVRKGPGEWRLLRFR